MRITYDPQAEAVYIRFTDERAQVTTIRLTEDVAVDIASGGRVIGIEVLDDSEHLFREDGAPKVVLQNVLPVQAEG